MGESRCMPGGGRAPASNRRARCQVRRRWRLALNVAYWGQHAKTPTSRKLVHCSKPDTLVRRTVRDRHPAKRRCRPRFGPGPLSSWIPNVGDADLWPVARGRPAGTRETLAECVLRTSVICSAGSGGGAGMTEYHSLRFHREATVGIVLMRDCGRDHWRSGAIGDNMNRRWKSKPRVRMARTDLPGPGRSPGP